MVVHTLIDVCISDIMDLYTQINIYVDAEQHEQIIQGVQLEPTLDQLLGDVENLTPVIAFKRKDFENIIWYYQMAGQWRGWYEFNINADPAYMHHYLGEKAVVDNVIERLEKNNIGYSIQKEKLLS